MKLCRKYAVDVKTFWGATLYHKDDLWMFQKVAGNNAPNIPDVYTQFRKAVESKGKIRSTFETPVTLPPIPNCVKSDKLPDTTQILKTSKSEAEAAKDAADISAFPFKGGETYALKRLHDYLW